jgi:hypothetical protein
MWQFIGQFMWPIHAFRLLDRMNVPAMPIGG